MAVTEMYINVKTAPGNDVTRILEHVAVGTEIDMQDKDDSTRYEKYRVTGAPVWDFGAGYFTYPVTWIAGGNPVPAQRVWVAMFNPTDTGVAHLAGTETFTGQKSFSPAASTTVPAVIVNPTAPAPDVIFERFQTSAGSVDIVQNTSNNGIAFKARNGGRNFQLQAYNGTVLFNVFLTDSPQVTGKTEIPGSAHIGTKNNNPSIILAARLTTPGPPTTGAWLLNETVQDSVGAFWMCTVAGTPGTWVASAPAAAGGGASAGGAIRPMTGMGVAWYGQPFVGNPGGTTLPPPTDSIYTWPLTLDDPTPITRIAVRVTAAVASASYRVAVYSHKALVGPDALLNDLGVIDTTVNGLRTANVAGGVILQPGRYWIAGRSVTAASTLIATGATSHPGIIGSSDVNAAGYSGLYVDSLPLSPVFPSTFPTKNPSGSVPRIMFAVE